MPHRDDYGVIAEMKRKAASKAPHAYATTQQPASKNPGTGRFGGIFPKVSGGSMQGGGKRRPNRRP